MSEGASNLRPIASLSLHVLSRPCVAEGRVFKSRVYSGVDEAAGLLADVQSFILQVAAGNLGGVSGCLGCMCTGCVW